MWRDFRHRSTESIGRRCYSVLEPFRDRGFVGVFGSRAPGDRRSRPPARAPPAATAHLQIAALLRVEPSGPAGFSGQTARDTCPEDDSTTKKFSITEALRPGPFFDLALGGWAAIFENEEIFDDADRFPLTKNLRFRCNPRQRLGPPVGRRRIGALHSWRTRGNFR